MKRALMVIIVLFGCGTATVTTDGGSGGGGATGGGSGGSGGGGNGGGAEGGGSGGGGGSSTSNTSFFIYGQSGELIGEYDSNGSAVRELAYLAGAPIAALTAQASYAIETDQLGTPRALTDSTGKIVWSWNRDAFGASPANDDPDSDGAKVTFPLRFPGQYFDAESGLHYNMMRDYDPSTGRYAQADPLGLYGGSNPYSYVSGNPISNVDPLGLADACDSRCQEAYRRATGETMNGSTASPAQSAPPSESAPTPRSESTCDYCRRTQPNPAACEWVCPKPPPPPPPPWWQPIVRWCQSWF
jgi:RHS repeat-associated protein